MAEQDGNNTVSREDYSKLEGDYNKQRERSQKYEAKVTDLEKQLERFNGIDPDEYKGMKDSIAQMEKERAAGEKDTSKIDELIARREKKLRDELGGELDSLRNQNKDYAAKVQRYEIVNPIIQKAAATFNAEELEVIELLVQKDFMFDSEGRVVVKGTDGKPRPSAKNPRDDMNAEEWLEDLASKHPGWVKSKMGSGGRDAGQTTSASGDDSKYDTMTIRDFSRLSNAEIDAIPAAKRREIIARS